MSWVFGAVLIVLLGSCSSGGEEDDGTQSGQVSGVWSDPATWVSNTPPSSGDSVIISAGQTIVLDVATAALDCLRIEGTLIADPAVDVGLTANCIEVMQGG